MDNSLTNTSYWKLLKRGNITRLNVPFSEIFNKFLEKKRSNKRIALEIGCVPGSYLAYICKNFGYFPEGIDFVKGSREITQRTLKNFGINKSVIYEKDFINWKTSKKYDLVCSFGFIEHFKDPVKVVFQHMNLLKSRGKLIIEIPNFNHGQKVLRELLDKDNLKRHNLHIMNLDFFKEISKKFNLEINFLGYYGGLFNFWWENKNPSLGQKTMWHLLKSISKVTKRININNMCFSPYIILIATKKN